MWKMVVIVSVVIGTGCRDRRADERPPEAQPAPVTRVEWWCVPRTGEGGARGGGCFWQRDRCRDEANGDMSTCVLADAPFCYDGSEFTRCFVDLDLCERHRVGAFVPGREPCYRGDHGNADLRARRK